MGDILRAPFIKSVSLNDLPEDAWTYLAGGGQDAAGLKELYQNVPWLFRGIDLRANAVARMPFSIYRGENEIDTSDDYQNAAGVLPRPGAIFGLVEAALTIWGYAYLFKQDNAYNVTRGLRYLLPSSITEKIDPLTGDPVFRRNENRVIRTYGPDSIVYFWRYDPFIEIGRPQSSPAKAASAAAGVMLNIDKFAEAFFARGAIKATLLTTKGRVVEAERQKLKTWWQRMFSGIGKAWQIDIVNADAVEPVTVGEGLESLTGDGGAFSNEKREAIATALGIPHSVLFSNAANFATSRTDDYHFYDKTIVPECDFVARVLNEQVFDPLGYRLRFKPETLDIFQEDENERAASLEKLVNVLDRGPIVGVAMSILGYEVGPEQQRELDRLWAEKDRRRQEMALLAQPPPPNTLNDEADDELKTWRRWALRQVSEKGRLTRRFNTEHVSGALSGAIAGALESARTIADVNAVFDDVWVGYP